VQLRYWGPEGPGKEEGLREGDVLLSNHPQLAGGSHLPDITVMTPVFDHGKARPQYCIDTRTVETYNRRQCLLVTSLCISLAGAGQHKEPTAAGSIAIQLDHRLAEHRAPGLCAGPLRLMKIGNRWSHDIVAHLIVCSFPAAIDAVGTSGRVPCCVATSGR